MGFLLGSKTTQSKNSPAVSGMQVQSSAYGKAIPLCFGTNKLAPNLIWYGDFVATKVPSQSAGKGGAGGGGGGKSGGGDSGYTYAAAVAMGLCAGPIIGYGQVWKDKNITTTAALGMTTFLGTYPQVAWGYLTTNHGQKIVSVRVPLTAPYQLSVATPANFLGDGGIVGPPAIAAFKRVNVAPAVHQYEVSAPGLSLTGIKYTFNVADRGKAVIISYYNGYNAIAQKQAVIPNTAPYVILIENQYSYPVSDNGVTSTNIGYLPVGGAPASNQYQVSGGLYTFNSANAGALVSITYAALNQVPDFEAIGYTGIAYAAVANYQMGNSPQLSNHNFELFAIASNSVTGKQDADPSLVVKYILSDPKDGAAFPASHVGMLDRFQNYCLASNLLISPFYTDQSEAASMLSDIAVACNSEFVWASGKLTMVPYGDQVVTGNGVTYTPPSAPLYDLTDDDFVQDGTQGDDPVQLTRRQASDAYNSISIEITDRAIQYNPDTVTATDAAAIDQFGLVAAPSTNAHLFADKNIATTSCQLQLQRQQVNNTYNFTLDGRYILLDPMDIVSLTDSVMGLVKQWVRIKEITENSDGTLTMVAEEYLQGTGTAALYTFQQASGFQADYNASPGNVNPPMFFEPVAELAEALEVWAGVSGGAFWGGCDVYVSNDDETYQFSQRVLGPSRMGLLTAGLPAVTLQPTGQTIDSTSTLSVDLTQSNGQLLSANQTDALNMSTLCFVDGEYISYQNAQLTGLNTYDITYMVRGCYGTTIGNHAVGTNFVRMDQGLVKIPFTPDRIGQTIFVKFLSFNLYEGGIQNLGDVTPASYTFQGTAYASELPDVTNMRILYVADIAQLSWDEIEDFRPVRYEIRKGPTWESSQILGRYAHPPFNLLDNDTYWVAGVTQPVAGLTVYSSNPQEVSIQGATLTSNVIASYNEGATGWTGTVTGSARVLAGTVRTSGGGNFLTIPNVLTEPDILNYGGQSSGTYQIPVSHRINIGRVAPCNVLVAWTSFGEHPAFNVLGLANILTVPDLLDYAASNSIDVYPEVRTSLDGITFGPWQKYVAGAYLGMVFDCRFQIITYDPTVQAILSSAIFSVDVPDRDDHYVNVAIASGGTTITFAPDGTGIPAAFNGGPAGSPTKPNVQVSILNAVQGDTVIISGTSLSSTTIQVVNGGVGVARNINAIVQGY